MFSIANVYLYFLLKFEEREVVIRWVNISCFASLYKVKNFIYMYVYVSKYFFRLLYKHMFCHHSYNNDKRSFFKIIFHYIPINVIRLESFDFTECDPMLLITIQSFLNPYHHFSGIDDVVQMFFSIHITCSTVTSFISHSANFASSIIIYFKINPRIPTSKPKRIFLIRLE